MCIVHIHSKLILLLKSITHLHIVPLLKIHGAIPSLNVLPFLNINKISYFVVTLKFVLMCDNSFRELDLYEVNGSAPVPMLGVGVRQGGQLVTGELNVNPGTALQMEIFLDKTSAPVYGLLVSYMQVTDTKSQEETIIFNG